MLTDLQRNTRLGRKQLVKNNGCVQIIDMACETRNENKRGKNLKQYTRYKQERLERNKKKKLKIIPNIIVQNHFQGEMSTKYDLKGW